MDTDFDNDFAGIILVPLLMTSLKMSSNPRSLLTTFLLISMGERFYTINIIKPS